MLVVEAYYCGTLVNYWLFKDRVMAKDFVKYMTEENPKVKFSLVDKEFWDKNTN